MMGKYYWTSGGKQFIFILAGFAVAHTTPVYLALFIDTKWQGFLGISFVIPVVAIFSAIFATLPAPPPLPDITQEVLGFSPCISINS